jgi:hypothetical protein
MILIALCLALLLGLAVVGGRVSNLASVDVKWGWLAPLAFLMQAYLIFFPADRAGGLLSARSLLLTASHILLLAVVWQNRHLGGVKLIGLGLLLNFLETGYIVGRTKNVVVEPGGATLWFLSDLVVVPRPFPIPTALSVGDLLIVTGVFFFLREAMFLHRASASLA